MDRWLCGPYTTLSDKQIRSVIMGENEVWCRAWRMIMKHERDVDDVIKAEIETCLQKGDSDGADYWHRVLSALDDLR